MIAIEGLASPLDLGEGEYDELEALRDLRHTKYEGFESIDDRTLQDSIPLSKNIMSAVSGWPTEHHSDLIATR